jgi:hypothetical protein
METSQLIDHIKAAGAFIPSKLNSYTNRLNTFPDQPNPFSSLERMMNTKRIFRRHQDDLSISTAALFLGKTCGNTKEYSYWGSLVKEHFSNLVGISPKSVVEANNKAFAYHHLGLYGDPSKGRGRFCLADEFGFGSFLDIMPLYKQAIEMDPLCWEPRYNIAEKFISYWAFSESPSGKDHKYLEIAEDELDTIIAMNPTNVDALLLLSKVTLDPTVRVDLLECILDIDPSNEDAKRYLKEHEDIINDHYKKSLLDSGLLGEN